MRSTTPSHITQKKITPNHPSYLHSKHKTKLKMVKQFQLEVGNEGKNSFKKIEFSSFARCYLKNHISSFLSPKFINFILWKIDSKGYNFPEDTFIRFCPQVSQISTSSCYFVQQKDRIGVEIQSTLKIIDIHRN